MGNSNNSNAREVASLEYDQNDFSIYFSGIDYRGEGENKIEYLLENYETNWNTARAGLIDEDALYETLKEKRIAGAALDVFQTEPLPENSRWLKLDNVTLTTHIAGTTADALNNSPFLLVRDIDKLLAGGTPSFLVNPEVLEHPKTKEWLASLHS